MKLNKLSLADRKVFGEFLGYQPHELSAYNFSNIYIWLALYDISWKIIDDNLCVFFGDKLGSFLYLPPLGPRLSRKALERSFGIMDIYNKNPACSRLENVEEQSCAALGGLGYRIRPKPGEYLCSRTRLSELRGDGFKSKRSAINYFCGHNEFRYREFREEDKDGCLQLYRLWSAERAEGNCDPLYRGMLKDNLLCLKKLFEGSPALGLFLRVIEIRGKIKAFTAAYPLNPETICVLYEFADLRVKGLSQCIFRSLCREMEDFKFVNIMDDSGLENLKTVKESYRPLRITPAFIADRSDE